MTISREQALAIAQEYVVTHPDLRAERPTDIRLVPAPLRPSVQQGWDAWAVICPFRNPLGIARDPDSVILMIDTETGEVTIPPSF
jgi:hypothetical protein